MRRTPWTAERARQVREAFFYEGDTIRDLRLRFRAGTATIARILRYESWPEAGPLPPDDVPPWLRAKPRGELHGMAALTEDQVRAARNLCPQVVSYSEMARRCDVDTTTIRRAVLGETWRHLKPLPCG